jgi:hypothetical protein
VPFDFSGLFSAALPAIRKLDASLDASQLATFNLRYYGLSEDNTDVANAAALSRAFGAKDAAGGGVIIAPPGASDFLVSGTVDCGTAPFVLRGAGVGASVFNKSDSSDLFSLTGNSDGAIFEHFTAKYQNGRTGRSLYLSSCQQVLGRWLSFINCPQAFYVDNGSIQCGLEFCESQNDTQNNAIQVSLYGSQCFLDRYISRQPGIDNSNGPTGTTSVFIGSVSTAFLRALHLSHTEYGLSVGHGASQLFGEQIRIDARTNALLIQGNQIYTVRFRDLIAGLTQFSTATSSGCIIDPQGGSIDDVEFAGSGFSSFKSYGSEIRGGTNIKYVGGASRGNGIAGIGVIGAGADVKVYGHDSLGADVGASAVQPYGFDVSNGRLWALGCDLRTCITAPTHVTSPGVLTNLNPVS